jgi:hypothetical protein
LSHGGHDAESLTLEVIERELADPEEAQQRDKPPLTMSVQAPTRR